MSIAGTRGDFTTAEKGSRYFLKFLKILQHMLRDLQETKRKHSISYLGILGHTSFLHRKLILNKFSMWVFQCLGKEDYHHRHG